MRNADLLLCKRTPRRQLNLQTARIILQLRPSPRVIPITQRMTWTKLCASSHVPAFDTEHPCIRHSDNTRRNCLVNNLKPSQGCEFRTDQTSRSQHRVRRRLGSTVGTYWFGQFGGDSGAIVKVFPGAEVTTPRTGCQRFRAATGATLPNKRTPTFQARTAEGSDKALDWTMIMLTCQHVHQ